MSTCIPWLSTGTDRTRAPAVLKTWIAGKIRRLLDDNDVSRVEKDAGGQINSLLRTGQHHHLVRAAEDAAPLHQRAHGPTHGQEPLGRGNGAAPACPPRRATARLAPSRISFGPLSGGGDTRGKGNNVRSACQGQELADKPGFKPAGIPAEQLIPDGLGNDHGFTALRPVRQSDDRPVADERVEQPPPISGRRARPSPWSC